MSENLAALAKDRLKEGLGDLCADAHILADIGGVVVVVVAADIEFQSAEEEYFEDT